MVISSCINLIKVTIKNNKKGFIIIKNNKTMSIIKQFLKLNIIKFIVLKDNRIFVFLNYKEDKLAFKNILNMYKPSRKLYINLKNLKYINKKHNWLFILSTSKGILNSLEAINLNVGGLIIAKIWN